MSAISGLGFQTTALLQQPDPSADNKAGRAGSKDSSVGTGTIGGDGKSVGSDTTPSESTWTSSAPPRLSTESQVQQGASSSGDPELSADTQRLVDMAIAANIDGPAAKFLATVMITQLGEQRNQALQDMMTARQNAVALLLAGAGQLEQAGKDLMKAAVVSLALNIVSSVFSFAAKSDATAGAAVGLSKGFGAAGTFASEKGQAQAKLDEATEKRDDAMAEQANAVGDRKKAMAEAIEDLMKQVISFVQNFQQTNVDMMVVKG